MYEHEIIWKSVYKNKKINKDREPKVEVTVQQWCIKGVRVRAL